MRGSVQRGGGSLESGVGARKGSVQGGGRRVVHSKVMERVRGNLDPVLEAGSRMRGWLIAQQRVGTVSRKSAGDRQQ